MRQYRLVSLVILVLLSITLLPVAIVAQGNSGNAHLCQHGGWEKLQGMDGTAFANQDECVSHAAEGGTLIAKRHPSITAWATSEFKENVGRPGFVVHVSGTGFAPNQSLTLSIWARQGEDFIRGLNLRIVTDGDGKITYSSTDLPFPHIFDCLGYNSIVTDADVNVYDPHPDTGSILLASTTMPVPCVAP